MDGNDGRGFDNILTGLRRVANKIRPGAHVDGLTRLTGGASLQTWAFDLVHAAERMPLILRRRNGGGSGIFTLSLPLPVEAALLQLVGANHVPVPRVVHVCAPADGLGEAYVVERLDGETLGRRIVASEAFAAVRRNLAHQCGAALAAIHAVDPRLVPPLETLDALTTLHHYETIHRRINAERPVLEAAFHWLKRRAPPVAAPRLVHGDFRNGNFIVDPTKGLVAVLDWEISHLGDAAEDFGWLCVNSWRFGRTDLEVGGFARLDELLHAYASAGGTPPPEPRIRYWQMLGSLKWGVMCLMMYQSYADGEDRSLERAAIGRRLSECEIDLLELMERLP